MSSVLCNIDGLGELGEQAFKKTTEAGCQRGANTYQCWPPLQLNDTLQAHKYTKSIYKKRKRQLVYKLTKSSCAEKRFDVQKSIYQRTDIRNAEFTNRPQNHCKKLRPQSDIRTMAMSRFQSQHILIKPQMTVMS